MEELKEKLNDPEWIEQLRAYSENGEPWPKETVENIIRQIENGLVAIIKSGIGSPQISVGGITELFWKCVESWKERRMESVLDEP